MRRYIFLALLFCVTAATAQTSATSPAKPFVLGRIETLRSATLGEERTLNIYLPEGYDAGDTSRYPVIYLLDGSADEDFIHVSGLVQFSSFPWISRVPRSIVVGIANVDRKRDFTFPSAIAAEQKQYPTTGHSKQFIAFIEKELQPFIEKQYRTNAIKTIIGESLGGLLATEILFKKPGLFNHYILISPSLWWSDGALLKEAPALKNALPQNTIVYIACGKEGLAPGATPHVMEVDANVLADKLRGFKSLKVFFDYLPEETHATIGHQALLNAFKVVYAGELEQE